VKSQIDAANWKEAVSWFDALGRGIRSQNIDPESGDVFSLTCYDNMGRVSKTSNPFRGYSAQSCSTANGSDDIYWTTTTYDAASRPWKVTTPDGAEVETTFGLATSGSQIGSVVTVEDQAGKLRRSITNALGQLKRVDEPNSSNALGSLTSPNQDTTYAYDYLNNLTTVTQGAQTRMFVYDNLSRLKSAVNPESGTINYTYDANNNLATKTDARGITTNYTYDRLNRVTERSYAMPSPTPSTSQYQNSPTVNYYYDNLTNAKGKLKKVTSSVSTTEYTSFDILGRVTGHKQTTDGTDYTTGYTYKLSGALDEQTYPSGRVVKNELDASGDLATVTSKENSSAIFKIYANDFTYNAAGAVTSLRLGNGRFETTTFNSRLQPTQIGLGTSETTQNILKLEYSYGTITNNGNVISQTISVPTVGANTGFSAIQTYTYDELNRLKSATENVTPIGGSQSQSWKQTFTFDRYGNRRFDEAYTTMPASFSNQAVTNPTISTSNNRLTSTGWTYDSAGNTIGDPDGRQFTYDAENKQVEVKNSSSATIGKYSYDGVGQRVKKEVPGTGEVTIFVYDAAGKQIAEYSTVVASTTDAKVAYLTADHLGSPRINTDVTGAVTSRHDYHPFGEEIAPTGSRSSSGYVDDTIRKQFTGYERDTETELDFAQARFYSPTIGRFTVPDEIINDSVLQDPQSWNKYAYVRNNPIVIVDPTGKKAEYIITVDEKNKRITVTAIATIGVWSKSHGKNELANAAKKIEAGIESKWKGSWKEDGWKIDFSAQVSVKVFDKAKSVADVQVKDSSIMNIVELADIHGKEDSHVEYNNSQSVITKPNPDGTRPDVAKWDYSNAIQSGSNYEPAHEFAHILGSPNGGKVGIDLHAPGIGQAKAMSIGDFNSAIGYTARLYRDQYQKYLATHPNAPAQETYRPIYRLCCHK